ncbi:hypothetical protein [Sphingobium yanoikuyae]|jgi:hypothetical protein|uniref:hypothetical protein n=1 Tax=Sphingobium yanoikuyae TaxID=13690 RepID=UPI0028DBFD5E|nr:hypothetical protein [Sphingobium yanoikuyae]
MKRKDDKAKFASVFSQPVRMLQKDELLRVGGGGKANGGVDNHSKEMTDIP